MTDANTEGRPGLPRVKCGIYRLGSDAPALVDVAAPGDELLLLVEIRSGGGPRRADSELIVELERGEQVRHRLRQTVDWSRGPARVALRLHWGSRPEASSRLTCRLSLDGQAVGRRTVLLLPDAVDAQGRFQAGAAGPASAHTQLVYERALQALLHDDERKPGKTER